MKIELILTILVLSYLIYIILRLKKRLSVEKQNNEALKVQTENLSQEKQRFHEDKFRVGDLVFTANKNFQYNHPYYIIQLYGGLGGRYAIIHRDKDANPDKNYSCMQHGVALKDLHLKRLPVCPICSSPTKEE